MMHTTESTADIFRAPCYKPADTPSTRNCTKADIVFGGLTPIYTYRQKKCLETLENMRLSGVEYAEAMAFAINRINTDPTVLPGIVIGYEIRDTCSAPEYALRQSLEFVYNDVERGSPLMGIVGPVYSGNSIRVNDLVNLFFVPMISYASTSPDLSNSDRYPLFFRTIPSDSFQARAIAALIKKYKWTYVHGIYSTDAYGSAGFRALEKETQKLDIEFGFKVGLEIQASYSTVENALTDLQRVNVTNSLRDWKRAFQNGSVLVIFAQQDLARTVIRVIHKTPSLRSRNFTFIGCDAWGADIETFQFLTADGAVDTTLTALGSLSVNPKVTTLPLFLKHMENLRFTNSTGENPWLETYFEKKLQCKLADGTCGNKTFKGKTFATKVSKAVDAVDVFAYSLHAYFLASCNNEVNPVCFRRQVEFCKTDIEECRKNYSAILLNITFPSITGGDFSFNPNGDYVGAQYDIVNLKTKPNQEPYIDVVGEWDEENLTVFKDIMWIGDSVPVSRCSLPCNLGSRRVPLNLDPSTVSGRLSTKCWDCVGRCDKHYFLNTKKNPFGECQRCPGNQTSDDSRTGCQVLKVNYLRWSDPLAIFSVVIALTGIALVSTTLVVFLRFWNTPIVKANSRELTIVMLAGIMLSHLLTFVFIGKPTDSLCGVQRYFVTVFPSMIFGALLIKTNRIVRIFKSKTNMSQQLPCLGQGSQILLAGAIILGACIINSFWLAIAAPKAALVIKEENEDVTLACRHLYSYGLVPSVLYIMSLIISCIVLVNRMRDIPKGFNEKLFINLAAFSELLTWLTFVAIGIGIRDVRSDFLSVLIILSVNFTALVALGCFFGQKVFTVLFQPERNTREYVSKFSATAANKSGGSGSKVNTETE